MDVNLKPILVVVPTAHRLELLKDCLSSLVEQDFTNELYEVIVVDDGDGEAAGVVDAMSRGIDTRIFHIQCAKLPDYRSPVSTVGRFHIHDQRQAE